MKQAGVTLVELLVVLTIATAVVALGTALSVPLVARYTMQSSLQTGATMLRASRTEAIQRQRACRFVVDVDARTMSVVDTQGTTTTSDDTVLRQARIPGVVSVTRPDAGSPITFAGTSPTFHVEFHPEGHVAAGTGVMIFGSGAEFRRVQVYAAGGLRYEAWDGSAWAESS